MNLNEIEKALLDHARDITGYDDGWNFYTDLGYWKSKRNPSSATVDGLGEVEFVESTGGEDEGSYASIILKVTSGCAGCGQSTRYFKKEGYYASYEGYEWDGEFKEVFPTQKTITVFE